jgi:hypothetical protein
MANRLTACTVALLCVVSLPALAGPAITISKPGPTIIDGNGTYGFAFTLQDPETVRALGVYDDGQDGLSGAADVGLWDEKGNLLAETSVAAGTRGALIGDFRYAGIAPLTLLAQTAYFVGSFQPSDPVTSFNLGNLFSGTAGVAAIDPNIVSIFDYEAVGDSLAWPYPNTLGIADGAYLAANFTTDFVPIPSPEPASLAIMGSGIAGLTSLYRRKTKR